MILIIDNGNTSLKVGVCSSNNKLVCVETIKNTNKFNPLFKTIKAKYDITSCYICSVKPSLNKKIKDTIFSIFRIKAKFIKNSEFVNELNLSKFNLNEIGTDILAYALFLKKAYKKCIGFCYGTAIFAIGVDNSKLHGCIIFPIPFAGINELIKKAELISPSKKIIKHNNFFEFGANTKEALSAGANHYYIGIISSVVNYFNGKYGFKKVCFTGGNTPKLNTLKQTNEKISFVSVDNAIIRGISYLIFNKNKYN